MGTEMAREDLQSHAAGNKRPRTQQRLEDAATVPGSTVAINIAETFYSTDMRLLQAPEEVVHALTAGQSVHLVGSSRDQRAVLVTADSTYELCKVETSNMMMLVPPSEEPGIGTAVGNVGYHYEMKKCAPKFDELHRLLAQSSSSDQDIQGVTLEELEARVQGSREEIRARLVEMKAIEMDGRWYVVGDQKVLQPVLDQLLNEALLAGLNLQDLSVSECCRLLSDVRPLLVHQCLQVYGTPCQDGDTNNSMSPAVSSQRYGLDLDKVARVKANQVFHKGMLRPQKALWSQSAFMMEWEAAMPYKHNLCTTLLQGIALEEAHGTEAYWRYLPASELDMNPEVRLRALFEARKTWALQDLEPYLREVLPDQIGLQDFLLRHARLNTTTTTASSSSSDGGPFYSAK